VTRPRIRSIKPETWHDEKIGPCSRDARLLFWVLVTMADDEGRLRATQSMILGHGYPYDIEAPKRLSKWLEELEATGAILRYTVDSKPYIAFRHWRRHQRINRATKSCLPTPPDRIVLMENSVNDHGAFTNGSVNEHGEIAA
jgi:hypothetical protein